MSLGPYTIKNIPAVPGAYLIATIYVAAFPIYSSISAYGGENVAFGMQDLDDKYYIMPNFKLIVYVNSSYGNRRETFNNYGNTTIMVVTSSTSNGSSCKLYYDNDNNEILNTTAVWNVAV